MGTILVKAETAKDLAIKRIEDIKRWRDSEVKQFLEKKTERINKKRAKRWFKFRSRPLTIEEVEEMDSNYGIDPLFSEVYLIRTVRYRDTEELAKQGYDVTLTIEEYSKLC